MSTEIKYYRYFNINQGERFFKVRPKKNVIQVIVSVQLKKGRAYTQGISIMKYSTFIGSYGWKMKESRNITEISREEFYKKFNKILKKLEK